MTVVTETREVLYAGDSVNDQWDFNFPIPDKTSCIVTLIDDSLDEVPVDPANFDFVLTNRSAKTGYVRYPASGTPISGAYQLRIERTEPLTQPIEINNQRGFTARNVGDALDRATRQMQQLKADIDALTSLYAGTGELISPEFTAGITHAPSEVEFPNIYASNLRKKLEWDSLTLYDFLDATRRNDPSDNDCAGYMNDAISFLASKNVRKYKKFLRVGGYLPIRLASKVHFVGGSDKNGYIEVRDGMFLAADSWIDQSGGAEPMFHFGADSARSALCDVRLDCNGVCSGVLVEANNDALQIELDKIVVWNFNNPAFPQQENLFNNCIDVTISGQTSKLSAVPVKRYWNANGYKRPYGVRVGPKDASTIDTTSSGCVIQRLDARNWDRDRVEGEEWRNYTGVALWVAASDVQVLNAKTLRGNLTCIHNEVGNNSQFFNYHCSPYGDLNATHKPDSTIKVVSVENGATGAQWIGGYNECMMWLTKPSGLVIGTRFPRGGEFTDGNDAAVIIDAPSAGYSFESDDGIAFKGCKFSNQYMPSNGRNVVKYREAGGFTFSGAKADTSKIVDNNTDFYIGAIHQANLDPTDDIYQHLINAHASRALQRYRSAGTTQDVEWGAQNNTLYGRINDQGIISISAAGLFLEQNQPLANSAGTKLYPIVDGIGYGPGNGGSVTQLTNKTTAVTLNKPCGRVIMNNAALAAGATVQFALNNSLVTATDHVILTKRDVGANAEYTIYVDKVIDGIIVIRVTNISGSSRSDALEIGFAIWRGSLT